MKRIRTVKEFSNLLNKLCCNNCIFFIDNKCTETKSEQHEKDKIDLKEAYLKSYSEGMGEITIGPMSEGRRNMLNDHYNRSKDIDNHFVCENFKEKLQM